MDIVRIMDSSSWAAPEGMSQAKHNLRLGLALLLVLSFLGLVLGWFFTIDNERKELRSLPECAGKATSECLEIRPGTFDSATISRYGKTKSKTHHFETENGDRDGIKLKIARHSGQSLEDEVVGGIFVDGDLVGLESEDGHRTWGEAGWLALPPLWFLGVAAVLVLIMAACVKALNRINAGFTTQTPDEPSLEHD